MTRLRLATRGSPLARWQAEHVVTLLRAAHPDLDVELVVVETEGDRRADVPIAALAGRGVFVKEVQAAVLDGRADLAVHSAKDLPSETPAGLTIAAVPERGNPRDALVGGRLDDLPVGARVATGSVRRRAQLANQRPDLTFEDLRGNIDTRLARAGDRDGPSAVVIAAAALERLGRRPAVVDVLDPTVLVPQVGQGALAVECRIADERTRRVVAAIEHAPSRTAVDAERRFLATVGGGCDLPVGAHATVTSDDIELEGMLASLDGNVVVRRRATGTDPTVGEAAARDLLTLDGGADLLADLRPASAAPR